MTIHLRTETDSRGDAVDYRWYCSRTCWADSFEGTPASVSVEEGGAYPCGAEHDSPDFCATCGDPVGNPLTDEGYATVQEWIVDLPFRMDPTGTLRTRMEQLLATYGDGLVERYARA